MSGSGHDTDRKSKKSMDASGSAWMARWTHASCETAIKDHHHLPLKVDVSEFRRVQIAEENMKPSPREVSTERRSIQLFPMYDISQLRESSMAFNNDRSTVFGGEVRNSKADLTLNRNEIGQHLRLGQAYPKVVTSSRGCSLKLGDDLLSQEEQQKSYKGLEKNALPFPSYFEEDRSFEFRGKKPRIESLAYRQVENTPPSPGFEYVDNFSSKSFSEIPVIENRKNKKMDTSRLSQTTRQFMITEKTDVKLSEDSRAFRESTASMKLKGKMFGESLDLFPDLNSRYQQGVKLKPTRSSTDEEGKAKIEVKKSTACLKNEASAETNTMDMDDFQRNRLSGTASSLSNKGVEGKQSSTTTPVRTETLYTNLELGIVPDRESSRDNDMKPSTSKTKSMKAELSPSNAKMPTKSNRVESEPTSRWVKRLKKSDSDSTCHRTKSLTAEESSPHKKGFRPVGSETLVKNSRSKDVTLLHPWVQRWCRGKAVSDKTEPEAVCVLQSSEGTAKDELEKKQFPSIAAMALMGKALRRSSPSDLRKCGSLMVWNTGDFS